MKDKLHFVCLSCGKVFNFPQKQKDCKTCKQKFILGTYYDKCSVCGNPVIDNRYPVCPSCYYKAKTLDEKLYEQYMKGR